MARPAARQGAAVEEALPLKDSRVDVRCCANSRASQITQNIALVVAGKYHCVCCFVESCLSASPVSACALSVRTVEVRRLGG